MSRFEDTLRRDLHQIADRATPSPDAWASIQQRIADQEPIQETEVIMLTDNTIQTRRWPLVAAAAAVLALIVGVIAVVNRGDGATDPADQPPAPTVAPQPETAPDAGAATEFPDAGSVLEPGRYTSEAPGVTVTLTLGEGQTAPWTLVAEESGGLQLWSDDTAREFIAIGRIGSWFDADESRDGSTTGLGGIAPDDIDGWIEANGITVVDSADVEVGGRPAKYRQIRLDTAPGASADFCPSGEQPCLWAISGSADIIDGTATPVPFSRDRLHSIWLVDMGEFEPLIVLAIPNLDDEATWFEETVRPIVDSIELGEPAPAVDGGTARVGVDTDAPAAVDGLWQGEELPAGRYTSNRLGVPITFDVPAGTDWTVTLNTDAALRFGRRGVFVAFSRIGSFYDAEEALDPNMSGPGSIPADDFDGFVAANDLIVDASRDGTIGGRPAIFRTIRIPDGTGAELCPGATQPKPCIQIGSHSADLGDLVIACCDRSLPYSFWFVDMDVYEPLAISIYSSDPDGLQAWLDELAPLLESITFGEPGPAAEGGTARLPERVAVTAEMTVAQTGEPNLEQPWPIERTGTIVGDIDGTIAGTGISSPNAAEATLDWVMEVTIDGLGTGTLTLRSYQTWSGDGYIVAADHVLGGTGDLEGVTGFGTTKHTESFPDGAGFRATIELQLAPPAG